MSLDGAEKYPLEFLRGLITGTSSRKRKVIGVIGGIASGKSVVRKVLGEIGAAVIDADAIAHEVLERRDVALAVSEQLGISDLVQELDDSEWLKLRERIGQPSSPAPKTHVKVDRKKIAKVVFGSSAEAKLALEKLENIVQPRISETIMGLLEAWRNASEPALMVLDIPLLFERGWDLQCDEVWFVDTPIEKRIQFAEARGWKSDDLVSRESAQMNIDEKRLRSNVVIMNDSDLESFKQRIFRELVETLN